MSDHLAINKYLHFKKFLKSSLSKYIFSILLISAVGAILYYLHLHIGYQAVSLVFLFIISIMPLLNFGRGPIFLAAVLSAFIWNFYFIPPYYTLRIGKVEDALMFGLYFIFASVLGLLISRIKTQEQLINQREKKTNSLYNLAKDLSSAKTINDVINFSIKQLKEIFNCEVCFILSEGEKQLLRSPHSASTFSLDEADWNTAQWSLYNSQKAGRFTELFLITDATFYPIITKTNNLGVVGLLFPEEATFSSDSETLLNTFLSQISIAIEREYLKEQSKHNLVIAESEKLYKTLFDSISHELKTPITTIVGALSSLNDERIINNHLAFTRLINETNIAAERLNRLVENLLDITRIESGNLTPKKDWNSITDLINSAVEKINLISDGHKITVNVNDNVGIITFDFPLLEQALINIIHNSLEYTPEGCTTNIEAKKIQDYIKIIISDNGAGFPDSAIVNLFDKFYRIPGTKAGGTGLGLSIAKGFIEAHGGNISARNSKTGGAEFIILLPTN